MQEEKNEFLIKDRKMCISGLWPSISLLTSLFSSSHIEESGLTGHWTPPGEMQLEKFG